MPELAIQQPALIGRETELTKLKHSLDNSLVGKGSTIFIAGEAGIGKTRLVSELIKAAESKNVQVIQGRCLLESLEPLMPIKSALREAGLFHLISGDPPPLVVSAYLMNDAGLLIAKSVREELGLDPYIFGSMLKAVGSFVKDSMQMVDNVDRTGGLNSIGYQEYKILVEESEGLYLAVVTKGSFSEFLVSDMRSVLADVQFSFSNVLKDWDGDLGKLEGIDSITSKLIKSGKYDGKFLVDDPKIRQENLLDNVLLGIQRLAQEQPILLFLDDLHWADPSTLGLLHYLARNTKNNPVLIVGDYRPEDIVQQSDGKAHQLETAMQNMTREDLLEKIDLDRLDRAGTEELVRTTLGTVNFENELYDRIFRETEGTPFFVLEVVKLLAEEGWIKQDEEGTWTATTGLEKMDIPSKVYDVVKRRLDRLKKDQREILDCASVVGEEFQTEVVGKTMDLNKLALLKNLSDIEKTHKLIHSMEKRFRFDHAKVREVLYSEIIDELKLEYHRLVADTIMELHKDDIDSVLSDLAYHLYWAKDVRAGEYLIKAADAAKERYANEEAIRLYNYALTILHGNKQSDTRDADLGNVYMRLGNLFYEISEWNNSIKYYEKALIMGQKIKNENLILTAITFIGHSKRSIGNCKGAEIDYQNAIEIAKRLHNQTSIGEIERGLGYLHWRKGENDQAMKHYNQSIYHSLKAGGSYSIAITYIDMGNVYHNWGKFEKAIECYIKSINELEKIGNLSELTRAYNNLGDTYLRLKDWERALDAINKCQAISEKIGNRLMVGWSLFHYAEALANIGELEKAEEFCSKALLVLEKLNDELGINGALRSLGIIYRHKKLWNKAIEVTQKSIKIIEQQWIPFDLATTYYDLALIYQDMGDIKGAIGYFETSKNYYKEIGANELAENVENHIKKISCQEN